MILSAMAERSILDDERAELAARAASVSDHLLSGRTGILLEGSASRTSLAIPVILDRLATSLGDRLLTVRYRAAGSTPDDLRAQVGRAHAGRTHPETRLVLVVEDADALSSPLLLELELAAGAAAEFGGLQFLLAATGPLAPRLERKGLKALATCLSTTVSLLPPATRPGPMPAPMAAPTMALALSPTMTPATQAGPEIERTRLAQSSAWTDPPRFWPRLLIAALAGAGVAALVVRVVDLRQTGPVTTPPATMQPALAPLPATPTILPMPPTTPAPVPAPASPAVPAPAVTAPAAPAPAILAPAVPAPATPSPVVPAPAISAPTAPAPATPPPVVPAPAAPAPAPAVLAPAPPTISVPAPSDAPRPAPVPSTAEPAPQPVPLPPPPSSSLLVVAEPGDTLASLYGTIYAGMTPPPFAAVVAVNPTTIRAGTRLVFPAPVNGWRRP